MAHFDRDRTELPTTDSDGNAITADNPLTLEDVMVRILESTDPVLGLRAGRTLDLADEDASVTESPYAWALLGLFMRDIFMNGRIDDLKAIIDGLNLTIPDASTTEKGKIEIATPTEAHALSDLFRAITPYLLGEVLRGTSGAATTTRRGTSERATDTESATASDTERYVPPSGLRAFLRGAIAAATTTYRGAVEKLTQTEAREATDTERYAPIGTILDALRNGTPFRATETQSGVSKRATQAEVDATSNPSTSRHLTPATFQGSEVIQSILPEGDLPIFRQSNTGSPLNFTSDIIGDLGIFKVVATIVRNILYIETTKWIPVSTDSMITYNVSESEFNIDNSINVTWRNTTPIGWYVENAIAGIGDIYYILMLKVRD